jgi:hypothetical protein
LKKSFLYFFPGASFFPARGKKEKYFLLFPFPEVPNSAQINLVYDVSTVRFGFNLAAFLHF